MIASRRVQVPDSHKGRRKPWEFSFEKFGRKTVERTCLKTLNPSDVKKEKGRNLEEGPRLKESLAQGLIKVKVEPMVGVYVVPDPARK